MASLRRHPFFRSYGTFLPSSLKRVLSHALGVFSRSTCVGLRYGCHTSRERFFLPVWNLLLHLAAPHHSSGIRERGFANVPTLTAWTRTTNGRAQHILLYHPILQTKHGSTGILTRCPSATPFSLTLGPTNPGRTSLPQETLDLRRTRFSLVYALLKPTFSLRDTPALLAVCLLCITNALLPLHLAVKSAASVINLAPLHFRRRTTRPVSCYALFKG